MASFWNQCIFGSAEVSVVERLWRFLLYIAGVLIGLFRKKRDKERVLAKASLSVVLTPLPPPPPSKNTNNNSGNNISHHLEHHITSSSSPTFPPLPLYLTHSLAPLGNLTLRICLMRPVDLDVVAYAFNRSLTFLRLGDFKGGSSINRSSLNKAGPKCPLWSK
jgi:hypothetical protein